MSDEYLRRVAIHADIPVDDVPSDTKTTGEEKDAVIEIVYIRMKQEYGIYERHIRTGVLHLQHGSLMDEFGEALDYAIDIARSTGHPLLNRVYSYAHQNTPHEPGEDRIPVPWENDE